MQCCLHGWSFLLTTWLQLSKNCSSSRFLHMFRSSRNRAGRRSLSLSPAAGACGRVFLFYGIPRSSSLFFSSGRISRLVPQSFLPSFLPSFLSVLCPMFFSRSHRALQSSDLVCSTVPLHQRRRHCVCHSPAFVAISPYSTNSLSLPRLSCNDARR